MINDKDLTKKTDKRDMPTYKGKDKKTFKIWGKKILIAFLKNVDEMIYSSILIILFMVTVSVKVGSLRNSNYDIDVGHRVVSCPTKI